MYPSAHEDGSSFLGRQRFATPSVAATRGDALQFAIAKKKRELTVLVSSAEAAANSVVVESEAVLGFAVEPGRLAERAAVFQLGPVLLVAAPCEPHERDPRREVVARAVDMIGVGLGHEHRRCGLDFCVVAFEVRGRAFAFAAQEDRRRVDVGCAARSIGPAADQHVQREACRGPLGDRPSPPLMDAILVLVTSDAGGGVVGVEGVVLTPEPL